jgi:WD40 repeat protein
MGKRGIWRLIFVLMVLATLGLFGLVPGCRTSRPVVEIIGISSAKWAKDGRAVLYIKGETVHEVYRYDLDTESHTRHSVAECNVTFTTSPDGQRLVYYGDDNTVNIVTLDSTRKQVIFRLSLYAQEHEDADIVFVDWLPNDTISVVIYSNKNNTQQSSTLLLDPHTGSVVRQLPKATIVIGNEGTLYIGYELDGYHLYDIRTNSNRLLPAIAQPINSDDFLHVSEKQIIYRMTVQSSTSFTTTFYRLDPKTLKVERWRKLPYGGFHFRLAPDLQHYFIFSWGAHAPGQVAVYRVPEK